ncbi:MAG: TRAP transporter small permease [Lachnospiraceae bacterium]|nr:TRAP transporter small permease [Lachnospiraceae bacterium]
MKNTLEKAKNGIMKIEKAVIIVSMIVMCVVIFLNTAARYTGLFTQQLLWAEELARYVMIWMAFLAAAAATQEDAHYKMTAIVDACPAFFGNILKVVAKLATAVFMLVLAKVGLDMCLQLMHMGQKSPILKILMWIPYASIPVSMILGLLQMGIREILAGTASEKEDANP